MGTGLTGLGTGIGCDCGKKDRERLAEAGTPDPECQGGSCPFMPLETWLCGPSGVEKQTDNSWRKVHMVMDI